MAVATTYYDVVTRYRVDNLATTELRGYTNQTERAHRSTRRLHAASLGASRGFMMLRRAILPLTGGMAGVAGVGYAGAKSFRNLNTEMNSTIQLASQLNLAFKYTEDPAKNFVASMTRAKGIFRDLVQDAAALPGEVSDFLGIGRMISGAVFSAGGSPDEYRELIGKLALITPSTGGTFDMTGLGAMQMLQGVAQIRNPLFRYMKMGGLLGADITDVTAWNDLGKRERYTRLGAGASKQVDDPAYRKAILHTWETQIGTLSENLFGSTGAGGQTFGGIFGRSLDWLTDFNVKLGDNIPEIVHQLDSMGQAFKDFNTILQESYLFVPVRVAYGVHQYAAGGYAMMAQDLAAELEYKSPHTAGTRTVWQMGRARTVRDPLTEEQLEENRIYRANWEVEQQRLKDDRFNPLDRWREEGNLRKLYEQIAGTGDEVDDVHRELEDPANVTQNFHIKLDVNTDESPEAVAVKIKRAMEVVGRDSSTTRRGTSLVARSRALK